jgi:alanine-synthesizing transaminase
MGAKDALAHLLFAVIGPGDAVVTPSPAYPIHQYGVIMAEGSGCWLPMPNPAAFLNALEDIYRRSSKPPKMVLISFPQNSKEEVKPWSTTPVPWLVITLTQELSSSVEHWRPSRFM